MMGGRGRKRLLCDDERVGEGESGFFYLTFELQVYMLFASSGAKHCPEYFSHSLLAVLDMYR